MDIGFFVPDKNNARLGDTQADTASNKGQAEKIANRHISVAIIVVADGGWMAFEDMRDYEDWKKQK